MPIDMPTPIPRNRKCAVAHPSIRLLAAVTALAVLLAGACADPNPLRQLAGIYVADADPLQSLKLYPDGEFAFRTRGAHPPFHNLVTDQPVPAKADVECIGPSGWAVHEGEATGGVLVLKATRPTDAVFIPQLYAELGCPDVSELGYTGLVLDEGQVCRAAVTRQPGGQVILAVETGGGTLRFVRSAGP
jgi:hypothetical protein